MRIFLFFFFSLTIMTLQAQLVNQGGTITVKSGATLVVESNLTNTTGSIVLESGATLEITGNFTNQATMNFNAASEVIFTGSSNSQVTSGGGTFGNVRVYKTSANVVLADDMAINGQLNFAGTNNKVVLGSYDLTMGSSADVTGADNDEYVQADGTGMLIWQLTGTGSPVFPVGDADDYSPLTADVTAGTFGGNATVSVKLTDLEHPSKYADATEYITRYWQVSNSDITGFAATLSGTYADGDVTGSDESLIYGTYWDGTDWVYTNSTSNPGTNTIGVDVGDEAVVDLFGMNFFGKAILKAFLQGPYSGGSMTTTLNSNSLIPLTSPYSDAPATVSNIPTGVTDWVKLELRDPSNPSTPTNNKASAFIKNDGTIVGLDGVSSALIKNGFPISVIVLSHRNHISIRTLNDGLDVVNPILYDFSLGLNKAYTDSANTTNDAMVDLGSGIYGLFRGNVNSDIYLNVIDLGLTKSNTTVVQSGVYNVYDVNLDSNKNVVDFGLVKSSTTTTKTAHL